MVVLAYAAWWLGEWQFHRLEDRKASNAIVERNEAAAARQVDDVLAPAAPWTATTSGGWSRRRARTTPTRP